MNFSEEVSDSSAPKALRKGYEVVGGYGRQSRPYPPTTSYPLRSALGANRDTEELPEELMPVYF